MSTWDYYGTNRLLLEPLEPVTTYAESWKHLTQADREWVWRMLEPTGISPRSAPAVPEPDPRVQAIKDAPGLWSARQALRSAPRRVHVAYSGPVIRKPPPGYPSGDCPYEYEPGFGWDLDESAG